MIINYFFAVFTILFLLISCSKDNSTCPNYNEKVEVQFDLVTGFDDEVIIKIDDKYYFSAIITGIEYFAGPQASFTTYLSRNEYNLYIRRRKLDSNLGTYQIDSTKIVIGTSEKYWVGLSASPDTILVIVQDYSFGYI